MTESLLDYDDQGGPYPSRSATAAIKGHAGKPSPRSTAAPTMSSTKPHAVPSGGGDAARGHVAPKMAPAPSKIIKVDFTAGMPLGLQITELRELQGRCECYAENTGGIISERWQRMAYAVSQAIERAERELKS